MDYNFEDFAILPENKDKYPDPGRFKRRLKYVENLAKDELHRDTVLGAEIIRYIEMCEKLDLTDW